MDFIGRWLIVRPAAFQKFAFIHLDLCVIRRIPKCRSPFNFAQGRLSAPLKYASFRMADHFSLLTLDGAQGLWIGSRVADWDLWFPTLATENVAKMGHPGYLA
jgi:hypothetical protein